MKMFPRRGMCNEDVVHVVLRILVALAVRHPVAGLPLLFPRPAPFNIHS
jgi:hypothetical protein